MDITATKAKTFDYTIDRVWDVEVDSTVMAPTFKLRNASDPTLTRVGSTLEVSGFLSGTIRATTIESVAPTTHTLDYRLPNISRAFGWMMSQSYRSRVELDAVSDGRTRVTVKTTIGARPLLSAFVVAAFVVFLYVLTLVLMLSDGSGVTLLVSDLAVAAVSILVLWAVLMGSVYLTAISNGSNSISRIKRELKNRSRSQ